MKFRYYLISVLICVVGAIYFAFWQDGNPLAIVCCILAVIVFTAAQDKQLQPEPQQEGRR